MEISRTLIRLTVPLWLTSTTCSSLSPSSIQTNMLLISNYQFCRLNKIERKVYSKPHPLQRILLQMQPPDDLLLKTVSLQEEWWLRKELKACSSVNLNQKQILKPYKVHFNFLMRKESNLPCNLSNQSYSVMMSWSKKEELAFRSHSQI